MTIPESIRALIGTGALTPTWRLTARTAYTGGIVTDLTDQLLTTAGSAITARADLTTAPARRLTISTTDLGPLAVGDPDALQYRLEAGYIDPAGESHFEYVGAYFHDTQQTGDTEVITNLASAEVQVIGRINYRNGDRLGTAAFRAMQETLPVHRFATYVREALDSALPPAWPSRLGVFNTLNWTPGSRDDFEEGIAVDIWDAVAQVATAAERRVFPTRDGRAWTSAPAQRVPGEPTATIPREHCTSYSIMHEPRRRLTNLYARYRVVTTDGEYTRDEWRVAGGGWSGRARTGAVVTMPGDFKPATTSRQIAWTESRLEALNTLVKQHTFTAPMMPWLDPEATIRITAPAGDTLLMISTIAYDVIAGTMTITAREIQE